MLIVFRLLFSFLLLSVTYFAAANIYKVPRAGCDIVGTLQLVDVGFFANIADIDQKYGVGYLDVADANPGYPLDHLSHGEKLLVPTRFILPNAPHQGIVINLPEQRLYYYDKESHLILTYPIGIGKKGMPTPLGKTMIVKKSLDPIWIPTNPVRKSFKAQYGFALPDSFPPGPENPLGHYAMRLGFRNILIHGTNDPKGVGGRVSAGCIRMQDQDVGELFDFMYVGMPVNIVNQPYKVAWNGHKLYLEAHPPLPDDTSYIGYKQLINQALKSAPPGKLRVNWRLIREVAKLQMGVPQVVASVKS